MDPAPEITTIREHAMTANEKQFFRQLGERIAALRKQQSLTQLQLADALSLTQQMIASYEVGRRRVPVSLLPPLARTLGIAAKKRGPAPLLQRQIERIQQLPRTQQKLVMQMLDGVISHASR